MYHSFDMCHVGESGNTGRPTQDLNNSACLDSVKQHFTLPHDSIFIDQFIVFNDLMRSEVRYLFQPPP